MVGFAMNFVAAASSYLKLDQCERAGNADKDGFCCYHVPEDRLRTSAEKAAVRKIKASVGAVLEECFEKANFKTNLDACRYENSMLPPAGPNDMPNMDVIRRFVETCIFSFDMLIGSGSNLECTRQKIGNFREEIFKLVDRIVLPKETVYTENVMDKNDVDLALDAINQAIHKNICESKLFEITQLLERLDSYVGNR